MSMQNRLESTSYVPNSHTSNDAHNRWHQSSMYDGGKNQDQTNSLNVFQGRNTTHSQKRSKIFTDNIQPRSTQQSRISQHPLPQQNVAIPSSMNNNNMQEDIYNKDYLNQKLEQSKLRSNNSITQIQQMNERQRSITPPNYQGQRNYSSIQPQQKPLSQTTYETQNRLQSNNSNYVQQQVGNVDSMKNYRIQDVYEIPDDYERVKKAGAKSSHENQMIFKDSYTVSQDRPYTDAPYKTVQDDYRSQKEENYSVHGVSARQVQQPVIPGMTSYQKDLKSDMDIYLFCYQNQDVDDNYANQISELKRQSKDVKACSIF